MLTDTQNNDFYMLLRSGSTDGVSEFLNGLFGRLQNAKASSASYQLCIIELFALLVRACRNTGNDIFNCADCNLDSLAVMFSRNDTNELLRWFEGLCHRYIRNIAGVHQATAISIAEAVIGQIPMRCSDSNLSLKLLAREMDITPGYLSGLIKRFSGRSFTDLLNQSRMERACRLLLNTDMKVREIAEDAGYKERQYFSYCFKRYYGVSPVQMRRRKHVHEYAVIPHSVLPDNPHKHKH